MALSVETTQKRLGANWFRKGGAAFTALAVVVLAAFVWYAISNNGPGRLAEPVPNSILYAGLGLAALCGCLAFVYQVLSIFMNEIVLSNEGIEIKRLFNRVWVAKGDVIRITGIRERAMGAPSQNRNVYKIVTNSKTHEVNTHEFFGLTKAIRQWVQQNMTAEGDTNNEA